MIRKKEGILLVFIVFAALICSFSSAIIRPGVPSFNLSQRSFGPGQKLEGYFNISLENQLSNIKVSGQVASLQKEMDLLDYLEETNAVFTCDPSDCEIDFTASNPQATKTLNLVQGSEVYYGFYIPSGNQVQIEDLSFVMFGSSGAQAVCYETPFKFDLLGDDNIDFEYKEAYDWCNNHASECFNPGYATQSGLLGTTPSCQKIWLNKTGKVSVSAMMSRPLYSEPGYYDFEFFIIDSTGTLKGNCTSELIGWEVPEQNFGSVSCVVGETEYGESTGFYIEEPGYYYVCVKKKIGATVDYYIQKESEPDICGFYAEPPSQTFTEDYAFYVQEAKFAPFNGEAYFNESTMLGNINLKTYIQNYIDSKYNRDCTNGCIIPLKFISLADQDITLLEPKLTYIPGPGYSPTSNNMFYDLSVEWPLVNMSLQQLTFSVLNLSAPKDPGMYSVMVRFGTVGGITQFRVESVPTIESVSPVIVIPGQETMFKVLATAPSGREIVEYRWNFGDNTGEHVATESNMSHTYSQIGTYTLTIKAKDNLGLIGSRSFSITSNITKELLNNTIQALRLSLDDFASQYSSLEYWYRDMVDVNVSEINLTLDTLESQLNTATQTQLIDIKNELDSLDVPLSIKDAFILKDSLYYANIDDIKPMHVSDITGESYDSNLKTQYQNAIALWQEDNLEVKISGYSKSFVYDDRIEDKITVLNIKIDPLVGISNAYVVFMLPSGVTFNDIRTLSTADDISNLNEAVAFTYSDLSDLETISIALPGKYDFSEFVFFVSPSLQELGVGAGPPPTPPEKPPYALAIFLVIIIVLVVFVVLWLIWKGKAKKIGKKKLFKNPMDLYNITNFISTNRAAGMTDKNIVKQLKKSGWSKKQIAYAFKKAKEQKPIFITTTGRPTSLRKRF